jgi:stage V sporulation protein SpoVS
MSSARPSLEDACRILLSNENSEIFRTVTEALFKIVSNVLQNPDEAKYRTLRAANNAAFQQKVKAAKGGVRFLRASGFGEEDGGAAFVLPANADLELLNQAKAALKAVVKHRAFVDQKESEAQRSAENAAAATKLAELRALSKQNMSKQTAQAENERQRILNGIQIDREDLVRQKDPNNMN